MIDIITYSVIWYGYENFVTSLRVDRNYFDIMSPDEPFVISKIMRTKTHIEIYVVLQIVKIGIKPVLTVLVATTTQQQLRTSRNRPFLIKMYRDLV